MERVKFLSLDDIRRKEDRDREAFSIWLKSDHELKQIRPRAKENLKLYVRGLISQIADLESDINRPFWDK